MTKTERRLIRGGKPGKDALYFLLTFICALALGTPGSWCLLAAGFTVVFFLLFLHSTRGGRPRVPASQIRHRPAPTVHASLPHRDAC